MTSQEIQSVADELNKVRRMAMIDELPISEIERRYIEVTIDLLLQIKSRAAK